MNDKVARIIDANCNRTREGIRVLEEIGRFWLDDPSLFDALKSMRHRFSVIETALRTIMPHSISARESADDVGKGYIPQLESRRTDVMSLLDANARRVEESLRVLEEFSKLTESAPVEDIKSLRFEMYTLEKNIKNALG
ncbi:MAG: thiamine-phosphate pyrophosphorylase [Candidatus Auribacterota bacterium]